jgi:hypothetical protein
MEWKVFVMMVWGRVMEYKKFNWRSFEEKMEERKRIMGVFFREYVGESWKDGKGNVMLGVCGEDWNWNYKLERCERFRDKVDKELGWK